MIYRYFVLEYHNGKCTRNYHVIDVTYCRFTYFRSWSIITGNVQEITMSLMLHTVGSPIFVVINVRWISGNKLLVDLLFSDVLILANNVSSYICLSGCAEFRVLIVPKKSMKGGIQQKNMNSQYTDNRISPL